MKDRGKERERERERELSGGNKFTFKDYGCEKEELNSKGIFGYNTCKARG